MISNVKAISHALQTKIDGFDTNMVIKLRHRIDALPQAGSYVCSNQVSVVEIMQLIAPTEAYQFISNTKDNRIINRVPEMVSC